MRRRVAQVALEVRDDDRTYAPNSDDRLMHATETSAFGLDSPTHICVAGSTPIGSQDYARIGTVGRQ